MQVLVAYFLGLTPRFGYR